MIIITLVTANEFLIKEESRTAETIVSENTGKKFYIDNFSVETNIK